MFSRIKVPFILCFFMLCIAIPPVWSQDPSGRPTKPTTDKPNNKPKADKPKPPPRTPVTIAPPTVLLTVLTEPAESEIYINGDKRGATNGEGRVVFEKMPLALYTVEARKEGFRNVSKPFNAGSDSPTLVFKLEPDLDTPAKQFETLIASGTLMGASPPNALALVTELSAKYPNHAEVVRMRGVLAAKLSDTVRPVVTNTVTGWRKVTRDELARAAEASAKAAELRSDDARTKSAAAYFRGVLALRDWQMGNSADGLGIAKNELEKITTSDATFAAAFYQLGVVSIITNDLRNAEMAFLNALRFEPRWAAANIGLGWVYYGSARPREAVDAYRNATTQDPTSAAAYAGLGLVRANRGEKDAVKEFDKAKQVDPASPMPHFYYGLFLSQSKKTKDLEQAEQELTTAIQKNTNNLEFQNSRVQQMITDIRSRRKK